MVRRQTELQRALSRTMGWNPFIRQGRAVRFRCMSCGMMLGIASRDMEGEYEHRCPICGHTHVFGRHPERWGTKHQFEGLERMLLRRD